LNRRIAVFGATGGIGGEVVQQAFARGYEVAAFVRSPGKLGVDDPKLTSTRRYVGPTP
jgi:uncharacterized protein YbjT (DUF2867 family)